MPDTAAPANHAPARHPNGRFGPGNPGRRAGARNHVSHRAAMAEDWSDIDVARTVGLARRALTLHENPRAALVELESALGRINGE